MQAVDALARRVMERPGHQAEPTGVDLVERLRRETAEMPRASPPGR